MKITRFYFEHPGGNTDTYINGIVSWNRAVNLAQSIQTCSASSLVRIWQSMNTAVNGTLDPASDRRRVFVCKDTPVDELVDLSSYKTGSEGVGLLCYLQLFILDTTGHQHFMTIPNPLRMLREETSQTRMMLDAVRNAYLQGLDIKQASSRRSGKWKEILPNEDRKILDDYRKEHPSEI